MSATYDLIFKAETQNLTNQWNQILQISKELDELCFSEQFFDDDSKVGLLVGEFRRTASVMGGTYLPYAMMAQQLQPAVQPTVQPASAINEAIASTVSEEKTSWFPSYGKIIIAVASVVLCYAAVDRGWFTANAFYWLLAASIGLLFLPPALMAIHRVWKGRRVEVEPALTTPQEFEKKLQETVSSLMKKYLAFQKLILIQSHGELPEYQARDLHPKLYVRKKTLTDFRHSFSEGINDIVSYCNVNIWERRVTILGAMIQANQQFASLMARQR